MTHDEIALVLGKAASVDRRTIGRADVLAWHEIIGHLEFLDALQAVRRHYSRTRDFLMPSDILAEVKLLRSEREDKNPHPVRELPSRFEQDLARDNRISRGMAPVREVMRAILARRDAALADAETPRTPEEETRARAIDRAREERRRRVA